MKMMVLALVSSLLAGCFPSKVWNYRSVDINGRYEERYKGLVNLSYGKALDGGTSFVISAGSRSQKELYVTFQLAVEKGSTLELDTWKMILSSPEYEDDVVVPIKEMQLSVYGRNGKPGYHKYVSPGEPITGNAENEWIDKSGTDAYISTLYVNKPLVQKLFVTLPVLRLNGEKIETSPIEFDLVENYNYGYSLQ